MMHELVIDSFAGGGGASEGIRAALGRDPDIAVNHDAIALAMHRVNHPGTRHVVEDVAVIDSRSMCGDAPVGMIWMSPDCTDHSKAKGGAPKRGERNTRGLAWAVFGWVKALPKWQRPRVIFLENVEEFEDWGPLLENGKRCPVQKGAIFRQFVAAWRALGATAIEWRQRRAWRAGAPTIRKRLYMIIRFDGEPIEWPEPTRGNPHDAADARRIAAGELQVWRTAADIIDWSIPCPSIFDTSEAIKRKLGIRAIRPLAEKTMARIAKGTMRWVVNNERRFLVKVNHTGRGEARDRSMDLPLGTMTATRDDAVIMPYVTYAQQGGGSRAADKPVHTITASAKDQNAIVAPILVPRYGEREGQECRSRSVDVPFPTIVPDGNGASVVAAFLAQHNGGPRPGDAGHAAEEPVSTISTAGAQQQIVAAHMLHMRGSDRRGARADEPLRTESAGGNHAAAVYAFLVKYFGEGLPSQPVDEPLHTVTSKPRHGLVTVTIAGEPYVIVDIGMRMLTPRERFNAQGFRPDYIIDHGILEDGTRVYLTLEQQGRMCGNSVCPPEAEALVRANYRPRDVASRARPRAKEPQQPSMFMEAAE